MIINNKYLAEYSPLPQNYDFNEVKNYIPIAETIWVKPILGDELYDEIEEQVENNQISDENATLLTTGGLWRYLAFATTLEALPFIWSHVSQVGITLGKSDNSDSISLKDMTLIQQHLRNQVEALKDQLVKWLDEHYQSFPLYVPVNCGCGCACDGKGKLNDPNKLKLVYTPPRRCTSIR